MVPVEIMVRYLLEIFSLAEIGIWGWKHSKNWERYVRAMLPYPFQELSGWVLNFCFLVLPPGHYNIESNQLSLVLGALVLVN